MIHPHKGQAAKLLFLAILAIGITLFSQPAIADDAIQVAVPDQVEISVDRATSVAPFVRMPRVEATNSALDHVCTAPTDPTSGTNMVQDGSFEAGTPNPAWTESSTNYGSPLCDGGCNGQGGTDGEWYVWFGGSASFEEASIEQDLLIPSTATTLDFDSWVATCNANSPDDYLRVLVDDTEIYAVNPCETASGYERQSIDISTYADDQMHTIRFEALDASPNEAAASNFFIDNVVLSDNLATEGTASICTLDPRVIIEESYGISDVQEGSGSPAEYTIVLASQPTAEVTIETVEHNNQVTMQPATVLFNADNWNEPQLIEVSAVHDDVEEGIHEAYIWHRVNSDDPSYGDGVAFSGNGFTAVSDPRTVLVYISEANANGAGAVTAASQGIAFANNANAEEAEMPFSLYLPAITQ